MSGKDILASIFFFVAIALLVIYWFVPMEEIQFGGFNSGSSNFTLSSAGEGNMQFYGNMRYPEKDISYKIDDCPLAKAEDMRGAFSTIESKTLINFYPVENNEQISVTCDSETKFEGEFFVAGEGGPTNITQAGDFNVIHKGAIVLIRESKCENPNVAIHELLHALGFDHSQNPNNIMYEVSRCDQEIGQDTLDFIDEIYSIPSLPDLMIENATATMSGRYLDISMIIRNNGLKDAEESRVLIYADGKEIKDVEVESMRIGSGRQISFRNIIILQTNVEEILVSIDYDFEELKKENNNLTLEVKN